MRPKVSVIIPTYNRSRYITDAIESVLAQTFKDYEIIVIDDGSTDNTWELLKEFEDKIKPIRQENQGVSRTRNRAIDRAQGEYIAFLDSDDYWTPEKLKEQAAILDDHPKVGIVYGRMPIINTRGETIGMKPAGISGRNFKELLEVWGDLPTSTVMTRKACFEKAGKFDLSLSCMEDIDMWIRIAQFYDLYEIEGSPLAYYRRHDRQVTENKEKVYEGLVKIYTKIYSNFPQAPRALMLRRIAENQYLLAKENYLKASYKGAFDHAWAAIVRYPLLGLIFIKENDILVHRLFKVIKPYGLMTLSFLKNLMQELKWKEKQGHECLY